MPSESARRLRANMTDAERKLWSLLRRKQLQGYRFRRQVPLGRYAADFACMSAHLVVELDGGQHAERSEQDERRTAWMESVGYRVLRFWNGEVFTNAEGVLETIRRALLDPLPNPPPQGGREIKSAPACRLVRRVLLHPTPQPSPSRGEGV